MQAASLEPAQPKIASQAGCARHHGWRDEPTNHTWSSRRTPYALETGSLAAGRSTEMRPWWGLAPGQRSNMGRAVSQHSAVVWWCGVRWFEVVGLVGQYFTRVFFGFSDFGRPRPGQKTAWPTAAHAALPAAPRGELAEDCWWRITSTLASRYQHKLLLPFPSDDFVLLLRLHDSVGSRGFCCAPMRASAVFAKAWGGDVAQGQPGTARARQGKPAWVLVAPLGAVSAPPVHKILGRRWPMAAEAGTAAVQLIPTI